MLCELCVQTSHFFAGSLGEPDSVSGFYASSLRTDSRVAAPRPVALEGTVDLPCRGARVARGLGCAGRRPHPRSWRALGRQLADRARGGGLCGIRARRRGHRLGRRAAAPHAFGCAPGPLHRGVHALARRPPGERGRSRPIRAVRLVARDRRADARRRGPARGRRRSRPDRADRIVAARWRPGGRGRGDPRRPRSRRPRAGAADARRRVAGPVPFTRHPRGDAGQRAHQGRDTPRD